MPSSRYRVLVTNDDGVWAPGLQALWTALSKVCDVDVVAPAREMSATAHSITVHEPLRVEEVDLPGMKQADISAWSVSGTPTDCVKIAVEALLPVRPDFVVSGINRGENLGTDVLYSGTVSAAVEAVILGIPSIAISLAGRADVPFDFAAITAVKIANTMMAKGIPKDTLLNVNVPSKPSSDILGVKITRLGRRRYENVWDKRLDPRGRAYYWMGGDPVNIETDSDVDGIAVEEGYISVSPIHFDFTKYDLIDELRDWRL